MNIYIFKKDGFLKSLLILVFTHKNKTFLKVLPKVNTLVS